MSQSHAAKDNRQHNTGLKSLDLLYAVLLHVLILIIIVVVAFWQKQHKVEPLKRIEVMMISAKDLAKLERPAQAVHKKSVIKHKKNKAKHKAKLKKKKSPRKVKKAVKKTKTIQQEKLPKRTPKKARSIDDNFDPFAPVSSSSDVKSVVKKASTSRPELANLAGKQLSQSEKEHYIALMQAAVLQHWKVAASASRFSDPWVELELSPDGSVVSVHILESSGNQALDASLIRAIEAAAPFELPRQQFEFFRLNRIRFHLLK